MDRERREAAAQAIWTAWSGHRLIDGLPEACRPATITEGYEIQAALARLAGAEPVGWKIAATSAAGQTHIGVDGPLAGRLWRSKLHESGTALPAGHLHMAVVEAEFAFRLGEDLPGGGNGDYTVDAVMEAVAALHPAIEIPDSRFRDFTVVGAAQLIADNGCTEYCVLGPEAPADVARRGPPRPSGRRHHRRRRSRDRHRRQRPRRSAPRAHLARQRPRAPRHPARRRRRGHHRHLHRAGADQAREARARGLRRPRRGRGGAGLVLEQHSTTRGHDGPCDPHLPLSPSSQEEGERGRRGPFSPSPPRRGGEGRGEVGAFGPL